MDRAKRFSSNASSFEAVAGRLLRLELSNAEGEIAKACAVVVEGMGESVVAATLHLSPVIRRKVGH
ncbi:hypothetical protein [Okeania hirsuta]|uniref:hypothetical protein n=1 Tax=Okeania hirsuta TaxID=1458930 RepID=UPI000F5462DC|nr:hypothetical protein [Okeania hirsuta]